MCTHQCGAMLQLSPKVFTNYIPALVTIIIVLFVFFYRNYSSEEECTIIDDDDDATVSHPRGMMQNNSVAAAKRSRLDTSARSTQVTTGSSRYGPRMGVSFESGDSSEEEELDRSIPQRKRRR